MGDVISADFITSLDIPADRVIDSTPEWGLKEVVIIGFDTDGEFRFASSMSDTGDILYWLERAKWELFRVEEQIRENGDPRGKPRPA